MTRRPATRVPNCSVCKWRLYRYEGLLPQLADVVCGAQAGRPADRCYCNRRCRVLYEPDPSEGPK